MKQAVLFQRQVTLGEAVFQAKQTYVFHIMTKRQIKWLVYKGKYLITLSCFANLFVDQGYSQWLDDENAKVA